MPVQPLEHQREVPSEHVELAHAFIAACTFTYAKSVPRHRHSYCLRSWLDEERQAQFDRFARLIQTDGYRGRFAAAPEDNAGASGVYRYINLGGKRYWISISIDRTSLILNRAAISPRRASS